jgi:hypothetical protein
MTDWLGVDVPDRTCSVATCDRPATRRHLCGSCYQRLRNAGGPLPPSMRAKGGDAALRHLNASKRGPDDCWPWVGFIGPSGYGQTPAQGAAYRFAYETLVGPIPAGADLDHLCHSNDPECYKGSDCPHRRCVNPAHLEPVDPLINKARHHHRNSPRNCCGKGHEYTPENTRYESNGARVCKKCANAASARFGKTEKRREYLREWDRKRRARLRAERN